MKALHLGALPFLCVCLGTFAFGQSGSPRTYTSPDRAFQFNYPGPLILCENGTKGSPENWLPIESCEDQRPLCSDTSGAGRASACIAYPHARLEGYNLLHAAFSVNKLHDARTEADCLRTPADAEPVKGSKEQTIHGTRFTIINTGDAGLSHTWDIKGYRTFHQGTCYELTTIMSWVSTGAYDPGGIKAPSTQMMALIQTSLKRTVDSFRFLK